MYYIAEIIRDESGAITERRILGASTQGVGPRGKELIFITDNRELDVSKIKVSLDENGTPFLEEDSDKIAALVAEDQISLRIKRIAFGQRLIAIMSIRNDVKELSQEQIVQLVQTFADINIAWLNGSISTSRSLIDALEPDGEVLTSADKTAILAEIDANLSALGYDN